MKPLFLYGMIGIAAALSVIGVIAFLHITYSAPSSWVLGENGTVPDPVPGTEPVFSEDLIASDIHGLVNQYRTDNGLSELNYDSLIAGSAKIHSLDMIQNNYFDHDSPDGSTPMTRANQTGYILCGNQAAIQMNNDYALSEKLYNENLQAFDIENQAFEEKQRIMNEKIIKLNQDTAAYNTKVSQIQKQIEYLQTFKPNDRIAELQAQKQLDDLEKEGRILDARAVELDNASLDSEYEALQVKYHSMIEQQQALETIRQQINQEIESGVFGMGFAENISLNYLYSSVTEVLGVPQYEWKTEQTIAQDTVNGWIQSPEHNINLLDPNHYSEGIGVAINTVTKEVLITQDFC